MSTSTSTSTSMSMSTSTSTSTPPKKSEVVVVHQSLAKRGVVSLKKIAKILGLAIVSGRDAAHWCNVISTNPKFIENPSKYTSASATAASSSSLSSSSSTSSSNVDAMDDASKEEEALSSSSSNSSDSSDFDSSEEDSSDFDSYNSFHHPENHGKSSEEITGPTVDKEPMDEAFHERLTNPTSTLTMNGYSFKADEFIVSQNSFFNIFSKLSCCGIIF